MAQIEQIILEEAMLSLQKNLAFIRKAGIVQDEFTDMLANEPDSSRVLCFSCQYSSKKNKTSAQIKQGMFKCWHCGLSRRVR